MTELQHRGYGIRPSPLRTPEGKWRLHFAVVTYSGDLTTFSPFTGSDEYDSEEDAIQACYAAGRKEIDKKLGPSVIS
jgi:hypothetical protein